MAIEKDKYQQLSTNVGLFLASTNVGVINTSDGLYLVEAGGSEEDGKSIIAALAQLYPGKKIAGIFLTHAHTDHTGGAPFILDHTQAKIYAGKITAGFLEIPQAVSIVYSGGNASREMSAKEFLMPCAVHTEFRLEEKDMTDLGDATVETIDLPGHYQGMTGFLVTDKADGKKTFFLGDGFFGIKMLKKIWIPFIMHPADFRHSIEKIEATDADFYSPAHGETCDRETVQSVAEHNIMITLQFEELIKKLIAGGATEIDRILEGAANYCALSLKKVNYYLIMTTLRSYLTSMENEGKITSAMENNKLIWSVK
ncbi:MAG: MBL fold metallo-hydrolase [Treponema sp.]|nr:MBL fold metallo-hydrolase [Candidatus Treponema equi]